MYKFLNKNLPDFYKQINKMLLEEKYTETLNLTIQTIFEIEMLRIYKDEENIKNVDDIQKIFNENFIEEIKENIQADSPYKSLLEFISDLFNYLLYLEDKDLESTKKSHDFEPGEETKDIIGMLPDKKGIEEEGFSDEFSKSLVIPEFSITKIVKEEIKKINMDDIFFITDSNWKNDIKSEYKKYPSLLYFLFKNPDCEKELRSFLPKTDSIKNNETDKFPTFLLILRIFSDLNCYNIQMNTGNFFGSLIKEEIILGFKSRSYDIFKKSPDINWIGLLINNTEVNKYLSPKMSYIYNYLGNICDYSFKPEEEDKNKYKVIIHKMIDSLFNIIFEGKLDEAFSQDIPKIENKDSSKTKDKKINDILYLTKLPEIIQSILQEETGEQEKKLYNKFKEEIKNIQKVYEENKKIYDEFITAIEADTEEEKQKRIEENYNKKKNELESQCKEREGKWSGYLDIIKNIKETELSPKEYSDEIEKLIEVEKYLRNINKKYFNKEIIYNYIKITFKKDCKECVINYGDEEKTFKLKNVKVKSNFYLKKKR